uniref:UTP--glucose-1-phosphate uridylyltransferase n=1 Tax=Moniliophthora roreri TaxID=221103 RepID=A0A0W0FH69_MONRR
MKLGRNYLKNFLRLLWVLVIVWYELVVFHKASSACSWPDASFPKKSRPTHVLLVADPQIIDQRSYPDRNFILNWLTRFIVDLNLRKNWRAALRSQPDAVFFLGDMMDGGRVDMSDSEYEVLYRRFLGIFKLDEKIPRYCIPGNHDTGLGVQDWFSPDARVRYEKHFGPLNRQVTVGNHTFVLLDAPGLVEEDYRRHGSGKPYSDWVPVRGGTIDFVKSFAQEEHEEPVILLTHIPLSRPEGSNCGPLREKGTIRRGKVNSVLPFHRSSKAAKRKSWTFEPIREETPEPQLVEEQRTSRRHIQKARVPIVRAFSLESLLLSSSPTNLHHPRDMANLTAPRSDSFNARVRGTSHIDFKTATTGVAAKAMRNEISHLVATVDDPATKKAFDTEMQSFFFLFTRYLSERAKSQELDWDRIKSPADDQIIPYANLPASTDIKNLNKLAVLKVNGGLGTSMGMTGAKSALEVKDDMTFLDLTVRQIEHLNTTNRVDVPLILMTSFNTHEDTLRIIKKYANQQLRITTFNQSRYPRILKETLMPLPKRADDDKKNWYPPGHGDLYNALLHSGVLDQLLAEGKEYLFVSNSDNLGAVVDEKILQHMIDSQAEFLMEVTDKTKADVKGGTLIDYDGSIRLLEIAQVPSEHVEDFKSVRKFKIFNTNNLWVNLRALKRIMETEGMELEIIINPKMTDDGQAVIQLETAAGAAIKHFKNAHGINVPRSRFLPVKSCSDLLLIKSDIYSLQHGQLVINEQRMFETTPVIKLGDHFKKIQQFQKRFKKIPKILELDHLTVTGDVYFGRNVTLRGTVIVVANEGQRIDIPDGCILENRLLSGNLNMIEL